MPQTFDLDAEHIIVHDTDSNLTTRLPIARAVSMPWEVLQDIVTGRRDPHALRHMSRVCGYYSRIENWNAGKVGELKDRHGGTYCLP